MKLSEYTPEEKIKALVFGRFKVGKTWGAATFPRPNFMDFDKGIATLQHPDFVRKYGFLKDVEFEQFFEKNVDKNGIVRSHNAFDDACRYFDKWMAAGNRDAFDTWVIDSGTTLSKYALNKAIVLLGGASMGISSKTHAQAINTGLIYPKMQDYGAERDMVEKFVQMVLNTDKNVLLLCHERELTDDAGNVKSIVPLLTGKGVEEIPIKFDEVWNVQRRLKGTETEIVCITQQTSILKVGSRLGIPNQTPFEYGAIRKVLDANKEQRAAAKQPLPTAATAAGTAKP